ncbi:hypothetical protein [Streptomyces sp. H27-D2]|uniref:hypothetical protein n=1 Tax=Streptomyces sp. H27-D2 TaxID=3046304 RepID=UPI002DBE48FD|nr:hypothetical protein [Streptomyces sp. H27-D2]MEC4014770.1 hypothetical protein [Streptomyces sp. H27-D2]
MTQISITSRSNIFAIEVVDSGTSEDVKSAPSEAVGRITVGEFTEGFPMNLSFWSASDYQRSWSHALQVLAEDENGVSCLIASITDPENTNFIFSWPLYRSREDVYVQNAIIFLDELDGRFNPEEPWKFVDPHCTINEDGDRISEWPTGMAEINRFLASEKVNRVHLLKLQGLDRAGAPVVSRPRPH